MKHYIKTILIGIVIVVSCSATTVNASSASLFMTKSALSVEEGQNITINVKVKSTDQSINAVSGTLVFPSDMLRSVSVSRDSSILNIWTRDPNIQSNRISFEGVILNPGYRGDGGTIFQVTFQARKHGQATISFSDGAVLANDGLGTNILSSLSPISINIIGTGAIDISTDFTPIASTDTRPLALPVITEYSMTAESKDGAFVKGRGEPNALTRIAFEDVSHKSFGEQFMDFIQSKKKRLSDVLVKNNGEGRFEYITPKNLVAGVYNATPFLVDKDTKIGIPGFGVQLLINDSKIIKALIVFINVLILLIPIVGLVMVIYFIPWYSSRRMRILRKKMGLEEEQIQITQHQLEREDQLISKPLEVYTHESSEKNT